MSFLAVVLVAQIIHKVESHAGECAPRKLVAVWSMLLGWGLV
jgi:hypothetical protein